MKMIRFLFILIALILPVNLNAQDREYNGAYEGAFLNRPAFPLGGIGAGMICLEGTGALSHVSLRHKMQVFNEPLIFAAIHVNNKAKVLEGQIPGWKIFGRPNAGNGMGRTSYGFPRFRECSFLPRFPFSKVTLKDKDIPLNVEVEGWSPFIPGDSHNSSLPLAALEYSFYNPTDQTLKAVFSFNTKNFMAVGDGQDRVLPHENGFILWQKGSEKHPENEGGCVVFVDQAAAIDHCWFKGGWWDSLTLTWENIKTGRLMDNPPVKGPSPGASLFVPLTLKPKEKKTVRLMMAWHVPTSRLRYGRDGVSSGPAFSKAPSKGTAPDQQMVSGFLGQGLVNTFDPKGDGQTGKLTSPEFKITKNHIRFLMGGGSHKNTCMNLLVQGKKVRTASGMDREQLEWRTWNVKEFKGQKAKLEIEDESQGPWGHINVDHILLTDDKDSKTGDLIEDFEGSTYGNWVVCTDPACEEESCEELPTHHVPYYAGQFSSVTQVAAYWNQNYSDLRQKSRLFCDTFFDTTLPPEVVEAVAANLTILKSPTTLRQKNGRLWCWEGCSDNRGCCAGSCTHVWNYAQAICHLFPDLERSLRQTEFTESQNKEGHQTFRSALPIRPVAHTYHAAADGQLGGIMKAHREWRICGDDQWLKKLWPKVKQSLHYCIETWDPRHTGVLEEPHHNTYDIEYWGPDGHCASFYLGALAAAVKMGEALSHDVSLYKELLNKGKKVMEKELFNGEYFYQKIQTEGLIAKFRPLDASHNGEGYKDVVAALNKQGPKYQYGTGCLSDGILGFWMARMCGLGQILSEDKIKSNLMAIHKYNFKPDLSNHANPQRPSYAFGSEGGLLLCTWPLGGQLSIPFVYSDEVWTGIEYQAASHMMLEGLVDQGLDIVRACRDRYDGRIRNPFNEYECGHWYARAMSSYGLIQGLTGVFFDARDKTLYIDSQVGDNFKSFLSTATGFGSVGLKDGVPFLEIKHGTIPVEKIFKSGKRIK